MLRGLYTAQTGMLNEQYRMDILANNMANASTTGFKKEGSTVQSYADVMAVKIKDLSEKPNVPKKLGNMSLGVKIGETYTDFSQGSLKETGNSFDLALSGDGFFNVEYSNKENETSTKYTRDGNFTLTKDGYLVTKGGEYVLDDKGEHIQLDLEKETIISGDGAIFQDNQEVAKLKISTFTDKNYLTHFGDNMWETVEGAKEEEISSAKVHQGYLEMSNMSVVKEMVNLISIQRHYEANQKIITSFDDTLDKSVNQVGRI